jgi:hypothetical protein
MTPRCKELSVAIMKLANDRDVAVGETVEALIWLLAYYTENQKQPEIAAKASFEAFSLARIALREALADVKAELPN